MIDSHLTCKPLLLKVWMLLAKAKKNSPERDCTFQMHDQRKNSARLLCVNKSRMVLGKVLILSSQTKSAKSSSSGFSFLPKRKAFASDCFALWAGKAESA